MIQNRLYLHRCFNCTVLIFVVLLLASCTSHRAKTAAVCWDGTAEMYGGHSPQDINLVLNSSVDEYQRLVEMSLVFRTNAMGRYTISPDHVASKALRGGPLELISLYHKGKLVTVKPLEVMENLLQD